MRRGDGVQLNLGASIGADNRFVSDLFWNPPAESPAPAALPRPGAAAAGSAAQGAPPAGLRLAATDDKSTLSCLLQPPWWDLDRFPLVRFSYRIPPGVPVGLRLDAMQSEQRGSVMYVGGTVSRHNGGCPDLDRVKLADDDQWREATVDVRWLREVYPGVKLLRTFWFYTNGNGKKGQQFWFDDFRIERE